MKQTICVDLITAEMIKKIDDNLSLIRNVQNEPPSPPPTMSTFSGFEWQQRGRNEIIS